MTNPKIKGVTKEEILATFADAINEKYVKGDRGDLGLEGRSPMHVQEAHPTGSDVYEGDLHYRPSSKKLYLFDGEGWEEIAKQGEIGLEGISGRDGKNGKDSTVPGPQGKTGPAGKDADISEVKLISEVKAKTEVSSHEKKFDHTLIDPFIVGTKKVSEAGMEDGMVMTYDKKNDKLIYTTIKQVASKINKLAGRGLSLPSQAGNSGKYLTTDGQRSSWATVSGGSGDVATDTIWDAKGDLAVGTGANTASRLAVGTNGQVLIADSAEATGTKWATIAGTGDVVGPASATDNAIARFDTTTGKLLQDSVVTIADTTGNIAGPQEYKLRGTTSGTTAIVATAIAGTTTVTLPAATDTLVGKATTDTLTNKTFDADGTGNSITNIENADIKAAAAISVNKLAALTASRAIVSDGSGFISSATTTATEIGYLNGVTSAIQTQFTGKAPVNSKVRTVGFTASATPTTGKQNGYGVMPVAGTITGFKFMVDAGTATVKTWKIASGTAVPTIANVISTSGVSISSGTALISSTVTDFTSTAVAANDMFAFDLTAVSGVTEMSFYLEITIT